MEYKLNKIDTDLRERIKEATYEGKVHRKTDIMIEKDNKQESQNKKFMLPNKNTKKGNVVITEATKEEKSIDVEAFKEEKHNNKSMKGSYIDVRK